MGNTRSCLIIQLPRKIPKELYLWCLLFSCQNVNIIINGPFSTPQVTSEYNWTNIFFESLRSRSNCLTPSLEMIVGVQSLSCVLQFVASRSAVFQNSLSFIISWSLLKFMSTESLMLSNHLILCCPLLFLLSIFPSIRVFSNESVPCIRWPKHWSFSFSISPFSEYSRLTSLGLTDLISLQSKGLSSLLQHNNLKASFLQHSALFMV